MFRVIFAASLLLSTAATAQISGPVQDLPGAERALPPDLESRGQTGIQASSQAVQQKSESLVLSPGDVVRVHIVEAPELEQTVQVDDHGDIPLAVGGKVAVSGLSPGDAAQAVTRALVQGQFLLNPHVAITIERYGTQNVTVIGQVKNPGGYFIATRRTVLDVLALAGGLSETADRNIIIQRTSTGEQLHYFASNDAVRALDANVMVLPGDRVIVPKARVVYLIGDFNKPGGYPATTNNSQITVLQALAFAGGMPATAVPSHTRLIHRNADGTYVDTNVALSSMQKGRKPDLLLQPDDILFVPYSYLRNIAVNLSSLLAAAASSAIYIH
jgi:polysaccharide export outer membrane protein